MEHKTYVTFGQNHTHSVNGETIDKDCVAVITSENAGTGRALAFEMFGPKFCMEYPEKYFNSDMMQHFPRGLIMVN